MISWEHCKGQHQNVDDDSRCSHSPSSNSILQQHSLLHHNRRIQLSREENKTAKDTEDLQLRLPKKWEHFGEIQVTAKLPQRP